MWHWNTKLTLSLIFIKSVDNTTSSFEQIFVWIWALLKCISIWCCLLGCKIFFWVFFGLFLSKPSKVGKSYKLCLSGPTTVNTSHAENQTTTKDKDNDIYTNRNTKTQTKKTHRQTHRQRHYYIFEGINEWCAKFWDLWVKIQWKIICQSCYFWPY